MKFLTLLRSSALTTIFISGFVVTALAQPVPRPNPRPIPRPPLPRPPEPRLREIPKATLGTNAEILKSYSRDLKGQIAKALPSYDHKLLSDHLATLHRESPNGIKGVIVNPKVLQSIMLMEGIKEGEGVTREGGFHLVPHLGRAIVTRDIFNPDLFLNKEEGQKIIPQIKNFHNEAIQRLSLERSQIYSMNTVLRMVDTGKDLGQGRIESEGSPKVEGFLTYATRSIGGLFVEGSHLKLFSHNEKQIAGISVRWPLVTFHPEIKNFELRDKNSIQEEITQHALATLNKQHEYNVKMAVVLQPVMYQQKEVFIPALKVGLLSRPPGGGEKNQMKGEAGEEFFVNLVKAPIQFEAANVTDKND